MPDKILQPTILAVHCIKKSLSCYAAKGKFRSQYCDKLKKPKSMDQMSYNSLNKSDIKPSPSPVRATTLSTNRKQRSGHYNRHLDTNADAQ